MLDLEASESHSSEDEDDDDEHDENDLAEHIHEYPNSRQARRNDHQSFPKFGLLPYELRQRIWEMFCPDLTAKSRVYEFRIIPPPGDQHDRPCEVWENHILEQQTAPVRVMLSVYQESREHVLKKFPDVLTFCNGRSMIRWNRKNDVVILCGRANPPYQPVPGFSDQIWNLALDVDFARNLDYHINLDLPETERPNYARILGTFCPNLKRAFLVIDSADCRAMIVRWCASKDNHHYFVRTEEEEPGMGEDAEYMYCWRNSSKTREFTIDNSIPGTLNAQVWQSLQYAKNGLDDRDTIFQPLIRFSFETGLQRFEELVKREYDSDWTFTDISSDDEHDDEPDEYESSGIDDSEINEDEEGASESEDDLVVVADDSDQEEEDSSDEGGPTHAAHSVEGHDGPIEIIDDFDDESDSGINTTHHHHHIGPSDAARFSSIEPSDSSTMDEKSSSPHRAGPSRSAGSGRKRVLESDSEEEEEHDEPPRKAARISKESRRRARATVVLSDDEDEDAEDRNNQMDYESNGDQRESPQSSTGGDSPEHLVVISDDDDDEEEEEVTRRLMKRKAMHRYKVVLDEEEEEEEEDKAPVPKKIRSRRGLRPPASDTDDDDDEDAESESSTSGSDDSSEEEDDDEAPARPLTLAEKLELHRRNNPIPDSADNDGDDDDEEGGDVSGDDYDARNYADFQDDEEGNEISDEDEEDGDEGEGGLIMDMADEEEDEEDDEY
ncbi:hypothetical protein N0V85_000654 [Neurospora sp. IMI 360204]|nr:hypothetical protein N0V85_000654 [Neurospora sp. IMI 360204]